MKCDADVAVIGGGPAGLAAAIACARRGLRVVVLERRAGDLDKACGEGLMPAAVSALEELGVPASALSGHAVHGITWRDGRHVARARFRGAPALGVRRTRLQTALAERATECGVELRFGVTVTGLAAVEAASPCSNRPRGGATTAALAHGPGAPPESHESHESHEPHQPYEPGAGAGLRVELRATGETTATPECVPLTVRWVIGADGLHSRVRRLAGLAARRGRHARFGVRRHFEIEPWTDDVEITWARGAEAYVTPVGPREVGVALLVDRSTRASNDAPDASATLDAHDASGTRHTRATPDARDGDDGPCSSDGGVFDALLAARFPELAARLAAARPTSEVRGAGPFRTEVPRVVSGRVLLVGDASGYVDPITGEGLGIAFRQAPAAASAIAAGEPERYQRAARRIAAPHERLTLALLFAQRRPLLRSALVALLARVPLVFERLLEAQGGARRSVGPAAQGPARGPGRVGDEAPRGL